MTTTYADAVDSLQSFAELPEWLAALMQPGRLEESLKAHVPELGDGTLEFVSCRADRLRAKKDQWLARCRVNVVQDGAAREVVLVGTLLAPDAAEPALPLEGSTIAFGEPGYELYLPDLRVVLHNEEADPGLPSLGPLSDPEASARIIERMLRAGDYPDATVEATVPKIARYKPGSRCTLLYDMTYADPTGLPNPVIAKTHVNDKGAVANDAMTALWNTPLRNGDVVLIAEPLGYVADEKVLLQGPVPEEKTLKLLAREAFESMDPALLDQLKVELASTARALAALHTSGAQYQRRVLWTDELAESRDVLDRLGHTIPGIRSWAEPMLQQLEAFDRAVPADPIVSAHHDFRPAQVLLAGDGRIAFIDFDGAAMAEPGLDLGRFRGKLRDIGVTALAAKGEGYPEDQLQERLEVLDEFCDLFLEEYRKHGPVTPERVLLWETIDELTALLHTWTKVRLLRVVPRLAILVHQLQTKPLSA